MNKEYNNLTIDNLTKTDWFNQFDRLQQYQIKKGLREETSNVSIYAKKEFTGYQMREIRLGLELNLDVSKYAFPEYSWEQMENIKKELLAELDLFLENQLKESTL